MQVVFGPRHYLDLPISVLLMIGLPLVVISDPRARGLLASTQKQKGHIDQVLVSLYLLEFLADFCCRRRSNRGFEHRLLAPLADLDNSVAWE